MSTDEAAATTAVEFDPFSDVFFDNPYPTYKRLRDEAPVYHNEVYGFWALSRHEDVVAAHRDWQNFTSTHGVDLVGMKSGQPPVPSMIMMDPPEHHWMRLLVSKVFSPKAIASLEPMVRSVISGLLDSRAGSSGFDAVADFAGPFPIDVISRMLGIPEPERQRVRHLVDLMLKRDHGSLELNQEAMSAAMEFGVFLYELVAEKRRNPAPDMLSQLCVADVKRDDGVTSGLDDVEIAGFATLLAAAGAETVTKLVGNAVVLFSRNPDEWHKVLDDETQVPGAVEEILRYWPPSQYQGRFSTADTTWHDTVLPAGSPVLLLTGAATHDERAFDDPDRFDINRTSGIPIGFGHGIHTCLGAALARLESRVAIEEWARRFPSYEVDDGGLRRVQMANVAGYSSVPVSF